MEKYEIMIVYIRQRILYGCSSSKTFTTGHIWHGHVSEILQMNLHEIHPELVKQKTFNICTTMPKISEIKEKCRAVEPPLTPHTHQPPTISIPTLTLAACWKCFVLFMSHHTIPSFGSGWRELEENLKKVPLQNCVYNNKVQRDSNCVTTLTWGGRWGCRWWRPRVSHEAKFGRRPGYR